MLITNDNKLDGYLVGFCPNGQILLTCSNYEIKLWDIKKKLCLQTFSAYDEIVNDWDLGYQSLCLSPDGKILAIGSEECIILWDLKKNTLLRTFSGDGYIWFVDNMTFSPDGRILATISDDQTIMLWDIETRKHLYTFDKTKLTIQIDFSPCSKVFLFLHVCKRSDTIVELFDIETKQFLQNFKGEGESIYSAEFGENKNTLFLETIDLSTDHNRNVEEKNLSDDLYIRSYKLWDIKNNIYLHSLEKSNVKATNRHLYNYMLASIESDNTITLWDIKHKDCLHTFSGHEECITSVCFDTNGTLLASVSKDGHVKIWSIEKKICLDTFKVDTPDSRCVIYDLTFSPDGSKIAFDTEEEGPYWIDISQFNE
jgi:WD40 repeat protein